MRYSISVILCFVALLLPASLSAQSKKPMSPLTEKRVGNFIAAFKQVRDIDAKHGGKGALAAQQGANPWSPFAGAAKSINGHAQANQIIAAIKGAGFAGVQDWANVGGQVYRAYGAIKLGKEQPQLAAKMREAQAQIQKSKMSAAQKEQMMKMMQQQMGALAAFQNVPDADKAAVEPHIAKLEAMNR